MSDPTVTADLYD